MDHKKYEKIAIESYQCGFNCAQSVVRAFAEELGYDEETVTAMAAAFGGGMGNLRDTCGAVSGAAMVLGMKYNKYINDENRNIIKKIINDKTKRLAAEFAEINGSYVCRELLSMKSDADNSGEAYRKRPCGEYCAVAARLTGLLINED